MGEGCRTIYLMGVCSYWSIQTVSPHSEGWRTFVVCVSLCTLYPVHQGRTTLPCGIQLLSHAAIFSAQVLFSQRFLVWYQASQIWKIHEIHINYIRQLICYLFFVFNITIPTVYMKNIHRWILHRRENLYGATANEDRHNSKIFEETSQISKDSRNDHWMLPLLLGWLAVKFPIRIQNNLRQTLNDYFLYEAAQFLLVVTLQIFVKRIFHWTFAYKPSICKWHRLSYYYISLHMLRKLVRHTGIALPMHPWLLICRFSTSSTLVTIHVK